MSVIARFEVIPVREGSMSTAIASALRALDRFPVSYRTTATDTIIEGDTVEDVFAAVQAAHRAIPEDRVITSIEIDEDRRRPQGMDERVASVERQLGHPPQRRRPSGQQAGQRQSTGRQTAQQPAQSTGRQAGQRPTSQQPPQQRAINRQPSPPTQTAPPTQSQAPDQPRQPPR